MMNITAIFQRLFIFAGIYALLCIPAVLIAERYDWPEWFIHVSAFIASGLCFVSAGVYYYRTRAMAQAFGRGLAIMAIIFAGLWVSFVVFAWATIDLSGIP